MIWNKYNYLNENRGRLSYADERRKSNSTADSRTPFESDFGRVIFSPACRRLHDKTQVFPLTTDDNIHSRLTHSMEVMNIGLSFAINLCESKDFRKKTGLSDCSIMRQISPILKTSCLVHDIGNPPFGHFGEEVIQDYFNRLLDSLDYELKIKAEGAKVGTLGQYIIEGIKSADSDKKFAEKTLVEFLNTPSLRYDYSEFDGNAEGFRVLTKLQYLGDLKGLNLTYATLGSTLKYPNFGGKDKDGPIANHKHGVFHTEKKLVESIASACKLKQDNGNIIRHPLSFLMEAADSICYLLMDIEDAVQKSWIDLDYIKRTVNKGVPKECRDKIEDYYNQFNGKKPTKQKKWVSYRTALLTYLMIVATNNFVNNLEEIEKGGYNKELIEDGDDLFKTLKHISKTKILSKRDIISLEITGQAVITGIIDVYIKLLFHSDEKFRNRGKSMISRSIFMTILHEHYNEYKNTKHFKNKYGKKSDIEKLYEDFDVIDFTVEERLRLIRDFVACMTDKFAVKHYQKLSGQKI